MIDGSTLATIALMTTVIYPTRTGGYMLPGSRALSPRTIVLNARPAACLSRSSRQHPCPDARRTWSCSLYTCTAALRLPLLVTMLIGVAAPGCDDT